MLSRFFNRRKPATQTTPLSWRVWQYCGRSRGWEVIATGRDSVHAMKLGFIAERLFPERHHRVSCRPQ
jgi:hypothetical protein